jgi:hypothetical protein
MEGVNMLNVHYMHVWTYHNETPSYYYWMLAQKENGNVFQKICTAFCFTISLLDGKNSYVTLQITWAPETLGSRLLSSIDTWRWFSLVSNRMWKKGKYHKKEEPSKEPRTCFWRNGIFLSCALIKTLQRFIFQLKNKDPVLNEGTICRLGENICKPCIWQWSYILST